MRDIIDRVVKSAIDYVRCTGSDTSNSFRSEVRDHLHRFLNSLPDGEIISDGYFRGFKEAVDSKRPRDFNEAVVLRLGDIYDDNVDVMSTSERSIIRLMQQGGSWAERVYLAMPEVVNKLLDQATRKPRK